MANSYEIEVQAQPSIYLPKERTMKIAFSEPEAGVDEETGILLIIAGYGGQLSSNVYTKMRNQFADDYNLMTVQCDYFGYQYMGNDYPVVVDDELLESSLSAAELDLLNRDYERYRHILQGKVFTQDIELGETPSDFNDMGLMQAIDNVRAVKILLDIIKENGYSINEKRIYAYGFSHGGYLAYLCNAMWPGLFTGIIDNSAYLFPFFLKIPRKFNVFQENIQIEQKVEYKAFEYVKDEQIMELPYIYSQFDNKAQILCYAGETDDMTSLEDKKAFLNKVEHTNVATVTRYNINREYFTTTGHGLGADFVKLFRLAYDSFLESETYKCKEHKITMEDVEYETDMFRYKVMWEDGIPTLYREEK